VEWSRELGETANPVELAAELAVTMGSITDLDVNNWTAGNTRRLSRSLGKILTASGASDHLILGDGQSYSKTGTATLWPNVLRTRLNHEGLPSGGTGWVRATDGYNALDGRVTSTGTWVCKNAYAESVVSGSTLTFTADQTGTAVAVAYLETSAPFTVSVDGGTAVTVTPNSGNAVKVASYVVTGLTDTTHTVTVTTTGTVLTYIVGFHCYRSTGVRIHNQAGNGWNSGEMIGTAFPTPGYVVPTLIPNPDVIHVAFGFNDCLGSVALSTFKSNLRTIRAKWPTADVILYAGFQASGGVAWPTYVEALEELAEEFDCPFVNMFARAGTYETANANGLMSGNYYPSTAGHADWAFLASTRILQGCDTRSGSKTLTNPRLSEIRDANGVLVTKFDGVVPAAQAGTANYLAISNNGPTGPVSLNPTGSSANVGLIVNLRGTGEFQLASPAGVVPTIRGFTTGTANNNLNLLARGTGMVTVNSWPVGYKVTVPPVLNYGGQPGQFAADATGMWAYIGDGTTHKWTGVVTGTTTEVPAEAGKPLSLWTGTKAQYDAIATKSSSTIYVVTSVTAVTGDITVDEGAENGDIVVEEPAAEAPATKSAPKKK
jgi:hypothetical protein